MQPKLRLTLNLAGRALAGLSAGSMAILWLAAIWLPGAGDVLGNWAVLVAALLLMAALLAVVAAVNGHANLMLAMFLASFLPVGAFLLYTDHWLRWVGICCLVLLLGSLMTRFSRESSA